MESQRYDCARDDCEETRPAAELVAGSFCSVECHHRHRREKQADALLEAIRKDHRFCVTCLRQVKEVEPPTDATLLTVDGYHSTESVVGYEYETADADHGTVTDQRFVDDADPRVIEQDQPRQGVICACGATDLSAPSAAIRAGLEAVPTAERALHAAHTLRVEETTDVELFFAEIAHALREHGLEDAIAAGVVLDD